MEQDELKKLITKDRKLLSVTEELVITAMTIGELRDYFLLIDRLERQIRMNLSKLDVVDDE